MNENIELTNISREIFKKYINTRPKSTTKSNEINKYGGKDVAIELKTRSNKIALEKSQKNGNIMQQEMKINYPLAKT